MEKPKKIIQINITDMSDMGQGIGRIDGMVVFVEDAIPGDIVKAKITEKKKKFLKAQAIEVITPSENRIESPCPYSGECGGCAFMEIEYSKQLQVKEKNLRDKLERIGGIKDFEPEPFVAMDSPYHYRNKTEFAVSKNGNVGLIKQGTNEIVDIPECLISSYAANTILSFLRSRSSTIKKDIKKIAVRTSFSTGETMVILHTRNDNVNINTLIPLIEEMDDAVNRADSSDKSSAPDRKIQISLESVYIYNETKKKNPYTLIAGNRTINDMMSGLNFEISPTSFYQTNPVQTEKLFSKVKEYIDPSEQETIFDLYCGVGSIGLTLADSVNKVLGVEVNKDAVLDANRNAVINGIINATYMTGKAEDLMSGLNMDNNSVILIDPPRAGCRPEVLEAIGQSEAKTIIYVSCDPGTFARDAKILSDQGFSLKSITPVDMFPQTVHLELVGLLKRSRVISPENK